MNGPWTSRWTSRRIALAAPGLAACAAAFALAVALRLRQASAPLSFDEFAALFFSSHRLGDLWGWWMVRETNPPLFYTALKLWRALVPESKPALRLLPLLISLAQIALLGRFAARTYGMAAAVLAIVLLALSPSDIFLSESVRGYGLAKLAVTVSFIGLMSALDGGPRAWRGWAWFAGGAIVAIYTHTTMLLWPPIAALAVLADAVAARESLRARLAPLLLTGAAIAALSAWVLVMATAQLRAHSGNIGWIEALSLDDYASSVNLQLLLDGTLDSAAMAVLMAIGALRTCRVRATRLALLVLVLAVIGFKLADAIHPIVSDYTLHWAIGFAVLPAAAALADPPRRRDPPAWRGIAAAAVAGAVIVGLVWESYGELVDEVWLPLPQDWHYTVRTVARAPGAALLVSHEAIAVVVTQACRLEFHAAACPFPLVVVANLARSDSWAAGGYAGPITPPRDVARALSAARPAVREVYVFSRYVYTPLAQLGIGRAGYHVVAWDDGELIGPIPVAVFAKAR